MAKITSANSTLRALERKERMDETGRKKGSQVLVFNPNAGVVVGYRRRESLRPTSPRMTVGSSSFMTTMHPSLLRRHFVTAKMSHVQDEKMVSSGGSLSHDFLRLIWHLMKLMLLTSLLCATLLFLPHTTCRSTVGRVMVANNDSVSVSPLQDLLKGQTLGVQMLDTDSEMMRTMNEHSTLELKTVVIAETVVPYEDRHLLSVYVKQQLDASDVTSEAQMEAVLTMVNLAPMEAVLSKEEIGEKGSLRNSAVLALIKKYAENVHFMLIGVLYVQGASRATVRFVLDFPFSA
nr:uncharacterized protein LOC112283253 isoform X2 [Physcomitrium patens]|eukprot:XP_024377511.1 uncharacterized protein LOC112283253 isoform X2 [Physcomitrella patens]